MATDDARQRFADLVKLNGLSSKFLDRDTERRILEEGVTRYDLSLDDARGLLRTVAQDEGLVFESETGTRIRQVLDRHAGKKGKISKDQFLQASAILRDFSDNAIGEEEAKRKIKRIMIDNGWKPRRAGLLQTRRWFNSIDA